MPSPLRSCNLLELRAMSEAYPPNQRSQEPKSLDVQGSVWDTIDVTSSSNSRTREELKTGDSPLGEIDQSFSENVSGEVDEVALVGELRQRNRDLVKKVAELEQALQSQLTHSRHADTLMAQQSQELNTAQQHATQGIQELESSYQTIQHQQEAIETLSQDLESSQERVAQLERECALVQQQCNEQSHQISQQDKQLQELHLRLQQQRRHTWQFKSALNKCAEIPTNSSHPPEHSTPQASQSSPTSASQASPISAWSVEVQEEAQTLKHEYKGDATSQDDVEMRTENPSAESPQAPAQDAVFLTEQENAPGTKSPSPAITSSKSTKKRKSSSGIDLPAFLH